MGFQCYFSLKDNRPSWIEATLKLRLYKNFLALDLGSSHTVFASSEEPMRIFREYSRVTLSFNKRVITSLPRQVSKHGKISSFGLKSWKTQHNLPNNQRIFQPVVRGNLEDSWAQHLLLKSMIKRDRLAHWNTKVLGGMLGLVVQPGLSGAQTRLYEEATTDLGLGSIRSVESPLAAARGIGLDITKPHGQTLIDLGGERTSMASFSLGDLVSWNVYPFGGTDLDMAIKNYVEQRYRIRLSLFSAEQIKFSLGSVYPLPKPDTQELIGQDRSSGIEKKISLDDNDLREVLINTCEPLVMAIHQGLEALPPELSGDLTHQGVHLLGGTALMNGMANFLKERIGLDFHVANDPQNATIKGALELLSESLKKTG